jgi:hypothetical protein
MDLKLPKKSICSALIEKQIHIYFIGKSFWVQLISKRKPKKR